MVLAHCERRATRSGPCSDVTHVSIHDRTVHDRCDELLRDVAVVSATTAVVRSTTRHVVRPTPQRKGTDMSKPEYFAPGTICDLAVHEQELRAGDPYRRDGHAARTLVRENDLRIVLIAMNRGARIAEHAAEATVTVQVLAGHIRLHLPDPVELAPGRLLVMPRGLAHDVEALAESAVLVTLGWNPQAT
jgi:quercetin dioxygenase-like cupin family protein